MNLADLKNAKYISPTTGGGNSLIFKTDNYLIKITIIDEKKRIYDYRHKNRLLNSKNIQSTTEEEFEKEVVNQMLVYTSFMHHPMTPGISSAGILPADQIPFLKDSRMQNSIRCGLIVMELVSAETLYSFLYLAFSKTYGTALIERKHISDGLGYFLQLQINPQDLERKTQDSDEFDLNNFQTTIKSLLASYVTYLICIGTVGICHGDYGFNNASVSGNMLVVIDYGRSINMTSDLTGEWEAQTRIFFENPSKERLLFLTQNIAKINNDKIFTIYELSDEQIKDNYGWFVNPDIIGIIFNDVASNLRSILGNRRVAFANAMGVKRTNKSKRTSKKNKKIGNKNKRTNKPKRKTNKDDKKII